MMVEVTQADRTAAENFVADLRCDMTGTQVHNLAGLLASTRTQSTADLQAKLDMAVEALKEVDDTLAKLSRSLAELDAALLAQEIAVIALERDNIAALISPKPERDE